LGHKVAIICQPQAELCGRAATAGIPVWAVPMTGQVSIPSALRFNRAIRELQPEIVHTHSSIDSWLGVWGRLRNTYRLVRTRHIEVPIHNYLSYRFCHSLIVTGEDSRDNFIARGWAEDNVHFIPTGIDVPNFVAAKPVELRAELKYPPNTLLIAMVSVLRSWKGHLDFITAAEQLLQDGTEAHFLIIGAGPQQPVLAERLAGSQHREHITMLGHRDDIAGLMPSIDILVHPSTAGEGVPQSILQGWAAKKPVVATAIPNLQRLVEHDRDGLIVPPGDTTALAKGIRQLINSAQQRQQLGNAGAAKVTASYNWKSTIERTTSIYEKVRT